MKNAKVVLADDHEMILEGLAAQLSREQDLEVLAKVKNGDELLQEMSARLPDLIVMDISMPGKDGIELTREIKAEWPDIKILILSMYNRKEFVSELLECGADGYILKNSGKETILEAIRTILNGEQFFARELLLQVASNKVPGVDTVVSLTDREKEVVRLIAEGFSSKEVAENLCLSLYTVDTHRRRVLAKIDGKNTVDIVKYAITSGIVKDFEF